MNKEHKVIVTYNESSKGISSHTKTTARSSPRQCYVERSCKRFCVAATLFSRTWNQWTCPWTKQSRRLRMVHSGDWCLRLALRTHSGACQKRTNERHLP